VTLLEAIILGIVEGLTEFLPVSSTGHLTITEGLLGLDVDSDAITAFTAVIQTGAIVAVLVYFRTDILRLLSAVVQGVRSPAVRRGPDWREAWLVAAGSIPIGIVGLPRRTSSRAPCGVCGSSAWP